MASSENTPQVQVNKVIEPEPGEFYFQPTMPSTYQQYQPKLESILSSMKNKLESSQPCVLLKPPSCEVLTSQHKSLFNEMETLPENDNQYSLIFDTVNFTNFVASKEELQSLSKIKQINNQLLSSLLLNKIHSKGTLMILSDFFSGLQIPNSLSQALGNNFNSKLFIKIYILGKIPLMILYVIQKMGNVTQTPLNLYNEKLLSYEVYDDCTITKPISYLVSQIPTAISYMKKTHELQNYLQTLRPGKTFEYNVRTRFYTNDIDCTMTIIDSDDKELIAKKNYVSLIISKKYGNDYFYLNKREYFNLCKQAKASRIIMLRPSPFNTLSMYEFRQTMNNYILLFKFKECSEQSVPIMVLANEYEESYQVAKIDGYIVRDVLDKNKKELYRHLVSEHNFNDVQNEIKLILTSKSKIKQDPSIYVELPTIDKYKNKNLVTCLDNTYLGNLFMRSIISGVLFLDLSKFPDNNLKILVLGGGVGSINYFFNRIFKGKVTIDVVESNKKLTKLGMEFFGLNNYPKEVNQNIQWHFKDVKEFIMNNDKNKYYDLIVLNINCVGNGVDDISPPFSFFEENVIKKIHDIMSDNGMYILNLMAKSYQRIASAFDNINKIFPQIFLIDNDDLLNKILFCFKKETSKDNYLQLYKSNIDRFKDANLFDLDLIKAHKQILARVCDTEEFQKNLNSQRKARSYIE